MSGNPATSDPTPKERSYADEVTQMYNVMLSFRSLDDKIRDRPFSLEVSRLKGLVTTDESKNAPTPEDVLEVLQYMNKDIQKTLAELMTFSMSPQRRQINKLVEQQKLVANELKKDSSWVKCYRTHVDNLGTMYVLENDLTNPRLGKLEYEFLMKILKAPRKHSIWKKAADRILPLLSPDGPPLAREVLAILTECLDPARVDQCRLGRLQNEECVLDNHLASWLPPTICRILGDDITDDAARGEERVRNLFGEETFIISRFLIDMRYLEEQLEKRFLAKFLKHVPQYSLLIPMLSLQQQDIEDEIEYLRKKVEILDANQD